MGQPLIHYLQIGAAQGYSPHPLFDPAWYLSQTDDPRARANPLAHYLTDGSAAGLSPHALFYPSWYRRTQLPEEDAASEPLCHFLLKGGRAGLDPNPLFSTSWFLARTRTWKVPVWWGYALRVARSRRTPPPASGIFHRSVPSPQSGLRGENKVRLPTRSRSTAPEAASPYSFH